MPFEVKRTACPLSNGGGCTGEWCPLFVVSSADVKNPTAGECMYCLNQGLQCTVFKRVHEALEMIVADQVDGHAGTLSALAPTVLGLLGLSSKKRGKRA